MDLLFSILQFCMVLIRNETELPNPEICVNTTVCFYQERSVSPLLTYIQCQADYHEVQKMFNCFRSSMKQTIGEVVLDFTAPPVFEDNFLDELEILWLELKQVNASEISKLNFAKLSSLKTLILENGTLAHIPPSTKQLKNLTELRIINQELQDISEFDFEEMTSLKFLNLAGNSISEISQHAFQGLENRLTFLCLQGNKLTGVPTEALRKLSLLTALILQDNLISELKPSSFQDLKLEVLSLAGNNISNINDEAFAGLAEIFDLRLDQNSLTSIPSTAIRNLHKIKFLNLQKNSITELKGNDFTGLTSLGRLELDKNRITVIDTDAFESLTELYELSLFENNLTHVPGHALRLPKLERLELAYNQIRSLEKHDFLGLTSLKYLGLEHNRISTINVEAFAGLEESLDTLYLGYNMLTEIPVHALKNMKKLKDVFFGSLIENVEADTFKDFGTTIQSIDLHGNRITSFSEFAFRHLPNLALLNVADNRLTHLDFTVFQPVVNQLTYLTTSGNPLECSCDLYWHYVLSPKDVDEFTPTWFSGHQSQYNLTQNECFINGTIIQFEDECKQKWKPIMCNASSLSGCIKGDFCEGELDC